MSHRQFYHSPVAEAQEINNSTANDGLNAGISQPIHTTSDNNSTIGSHQLLQPSTESHNSEQQLITTQPTRRS
ncbi:hypothetical protein HAX54_033760, partial [Datura stramonium]|nr:hypothetical protein [Datura stramonium]